MKPPITLPIVNGTTTRSATTEQFRLNDTPKTFIGDAMRLWNSATCDLKSAKTLKMAKTYTKNFVWQSANLTFN